MISTALIPWTADQAAQSELFGAFLTVVIFVTWEITGWFMKSKNKKE